MASEIDPRYRIVRTVYFTEGQEQYTHDHDLEHDRHTCGYCGARVKRKYNCARHLTICPVKLVLEKMETFNFKEYTVIKNRGIDWS